MERTPQDPGHRGVARHVDAAADEGQHRRHVVNAPGFVLLSNGTEQTTRKIRNLYM